MKSLSLILACMYISIGERTTKEKNAPSDVRLEIRVYMLAKKQQKFAQRVHPYI